MGIVSGMMAGVGEGMQSVGAQGVGYAFRSRLQAEADEAAKLRDQRLSELRMRETEHADTVRRSAATEAGRDIDERLARPAYDEGADSARPHSPEEKSGIKADAYRRRGLVTEAQREEELEAQRKRDLAGERDRSEGRNEQARHNQAVELLQRGQLDELKKTGDLDRAIKQLTLDNAKRVKELREEWKQPDTTDERKRAIKNEIDILTGKDGDKFLPVPLKDETGAVTGYRVLNTKDGTWVDSDAAMRGEPSDADIEGLRSRANDPRAIEFFERRYGKGSSKRYLPSTQRRDNLPTLPHNFGSSVSAAQDPLDQEPQGYDQPPPEEPPQSGGAFTGSAREREEIYRRRFGPAGL